jgi:hypothetical protein
MGGPPKQAHRDGHTVQEQEPAALFDRTFPHAGQPPQSMSTGAASTLLQISLFLDASISTPQHFTSIKLTMPVSATPIMDLSRTRLKKLARWIRDDLDLLVAREGPHVLRPDDVLLLHETFLALRDATFITCNDLRATGVHRAIQDIAGVATRWPSRLCDDCDEIIARWTADFGPFSELHPFLYGRGGRLEGIASAHEQGREVR